MLSSRTNKQPNTNLRHIAQKVRLDGEMCRIAIFSFNVGEALLSKSDGEHICNLIQKLLFENDFLFVVLQEVQMDAVSVLNMSHLLYKNRKNFGQWENLFYDILDDNPMLKSQFKLSVSISGSILAAIYINRVSFQVDLEWQTLNLGFGKILSNKSAIGVYVMFKGNPHCNICIVGTHLPSDMNKNRKRIEAVDYILSTMKFQSGNIDISNIRNLVFCGDLNFRIELNYEEIIRCLSNKRFDIMRQFDQLINNKMLILSDFNEPPLEYEPTYKYIKGTNTLDEQRSPSWTDRILYKGSLKLTTHQIYTDALISDHLPISAQIILFNAVNCRQVSWMDLRLTYEDEEMKSNQKLNFGVVEFYDRFTVIIKVHNSSFFDAKISTKTTRLSQNQQCIIIEPRSVAIFNLEFYSNQISKFNEKSISEDIILQLNGCNSNVFRFTLVYQMSPTNVFGCKFPETSQNVDTNKFNYPVNMFIDQYQRIIQNVEHTRSITLYQISNYVRQIENHSTSLDGINILILHRIIWIYLYSYPDDVMVFNDISQSEASPDRLLINMDASDSSIENNPSSLYAPPHHNVMTLFDLWRKITISIFYSDSSYEDYLLHMMYPLLNNKTHIKSGNSRSRIPGDTLNYLANILLTGNGPEFSSG
ncbi:MAG: Inositol-1,4,5-trisphosphate 5-phosphatase 1 [Marteilia pararefringens]